MKAAIVIPIAVSIVLTIIAIVSCLVAWKSAGAAERSAGAAERSAETTAAMLQDARDADRATRERAEYLSYKLGMDVGMYAGGSRYKGERSLAPKVAAARDRAMVRFDGIKDDLGLGKEVPESFSKRDLELIKMSIYDTYGQRAFDSYVLGVNLGIAEGALLPWWAHGKAASSSSTVPAATLDQVDKSAEIVNKQLGILGFPQRIQLHDQSGASLYDGFNQLDGALIDAWDSQAGRWRRSPQTVSAEEASE